MLSAPAASRVKSRKTASCNFSTDSRILPTQEIIGAHNFNFAPKFSKMAHFQPQMLHFWETFFVKKKISLRAQI